MDLLITHIKDETPKGLTSGFSLKVTCQEEGGQPVIISVPVLITRAVLDRNIPLPNILIRHFERFGLDACPDIFVDTRKLDLDSISGTLSDFPLKVKLGGVDDMNRKVLAKLAKSKTS